MNWNNLLARPELLGLAALAVCCLAAAVVSVRRYLRNRPTPEELERRRRLDINAKGKLIAGEVIDVDGGSVVYSYVIAGVHYTASQDVLPLWEGFAENELSVLGPVGVKFDPRNPANSIVLCEEWSGLRRTRPASRKSNPR